MHTEASSLLDNVNLSEESTDLRATTIEDLDDTQFSLGDKSDKSIRAIEPTEPQIAASIADTQTAARGSMKRGSTFQQDQPPSPPDTRVPSVGELRDYFSKLNQSTQDISDTRKSTSRIQKFSYLAPSSSTEPLKIDADLNTSKGKTTSFEELRETYESGRPVTKEPAEERNIPPQRSTSFKSVQFFSRPPKFRTPSPIHTARIPTPPPLPLPPSPELIESHFRNTPYRNKDMSKRSYSTNVETHLRQSSKPIMSLNLPYRSRSLALDRSHKSIDPPKSGYHRYRAHSITQRSLSPDLKQFNRASQADAKNSGHVSRECQTPRRHNPVVKTLVEKGVQSPERAIVPWNGPEVIKLDPSETDGIYVRSAVVYERVDDRSVPGGPKHFVTTYVVGSHPTQETIQATNLWVAERALQSGQLQDKQMPPYRTQTLSRQDLTDMPGEQYHQRSASMRLPKHRGGYGIRPRSLSISGLSNLRGEEQQPPPLPTPPPVELHPYILRCSQENSPRSSHLNIRKSVDKSVQFPFPRYGRSPSPTRSWSVKSLSPPPFRTPWLSSLSGSKTRGKPPPRNQTMSERGTWTGRDRSPPGVYHSHEVAPYSHRTAETGSQTICQRPARSRNRDCSDTSGQWIRRAESVSRERQAYHEMRGSWSPPNIKSPARFIPNDLEERTEREIRNRVKRHQPLSPVPPHATQSFEQSTQTICFPDNQEPHEICKIDRGVNADFEEPIVRDVSVGCVDTTPITEDFDAKRDYFEEMIRTNQLKPHCSFCNDCFHCPGGQHTPAAYSSYSSLEFDEKASSKKEIPEVLYKTNGVYDPQISVQPSDYSRVNNTDQNVYRKLTENRKVLITRPSGSGGGPQQYSSTLYMTTRAPYTTKWDIPHQQQDDQTRHSWDSGSIQHEYYAKPRTAMPKVAPDPPTHYDYRWQERPHTELVHSPIGYPIEDSVWKSYPMRRGANHSPPCRFYYSSKDNSLESLHDAPHSVTMSTGGGNGRVRQIVSDLNERSYYNHYMMD